jgi:hypothetical protein
LIWEKIQKFPENTKVIITFPCDLRNTPSSVIINELLRTGFDRVFFDNQIEELSLSLIEKSGKRHSRGGGSDHFQ